MNRIGKSGLTLAGIAVVCTGIVALTYELTAERIEENRKAHAEALLAAALGDIGYDSSLTDSRRTLPAPHGLPGDDAADIYRAELNGRTVAVLFAVTAMDGYAGPIRLLIGVRADGRLSGVRVVSHDETPGLGDQIESRRTDWILQFDGKSLVDPAPTDWAIRADGGDFDQITGASVSSRAVLKAVRDTLLYFADNRDAVLGTGEALKTDDENRQ